MKFMGNLKSIQKDYITGKYEITVSLEDENALAGYDEIKDAELLDIEIKKHRKKRSLDANAYFHVLVGKLADKMEISKPRCKNIMIGRYGQPFFIDEDEMQEAIIKTNIPVESMYENEIVHCMPCSSREENGTEVIFYRVLRGSSTYNTAEMSILITGTISECKEHGVETIPPEELERMLKAWKS